RPCSARMRRPPGSTLFPYTTLFRSLEELKRQMAEEQALLLGRVTFEELRGYWPAHAGEPDGIGDHLNAVPKYVVSRTLGDPAWRSEEHTSELQSRENLVCRLLLEKK